jgi:hypothetical protein
VCGEPLRAKLALHREEIRRTKALIAKLPGRAGRRTKLLRSADRQLAAIARKARRDRKLGAACKDRIEQETARLRQLLAALSG